MIGNSKKIPATLHPVELGSRSISHRSGGFKPGAMALWWMILCAPQWLYAQWTLPDGARVHPEYRGPVPKRSDVVFSTRFKRPEALDVIKAFGATRVEWVYSADREFISSIKKLGARFGGALNSVEPLPTDDGVARDFDGNLLIHPRMKTWGGGRGKWITTTHPDTGRILRAHAQQYIEAGANSMQIDDPLLQLYSAYLWGGDFNPNTLAGFRQYLAGYPDQAELARLGLSDRRMDYREILKSKYAIHNAAEYNGRYKDLPGYGLWIKYLKQTVKDHFLGFRQFLNGLRGETVPLSMNLGILNQPDEKNWHFFLATFADYAVAETPIANLSESFMRAATLRALGVGFVPSLRPRGVAENRAAIAGFYALGGQPVVPWDVYTGNDAAGQPQRYFGTPETYGDLYRFVLDHPPLFDRMELAAVVGIPVPVDKFNTDVTLGLVRRLVQRQIPFAFLLVGGMERKFGVDPIRARNFKMLVMANPDTDFSPQALQDLRSLPVARVDAGRLDDSLLKELAPLSAAGEAGRLKLYPRADPGDNKRLILHLVDMAKAERQVAERGAPDSICRRRIGLKKTFTGDRRVTAATWYAGGSVTRLSPGETGKEFFFSIPDCIFWGILSLDMR